jgi:hypothetical protein
MLDQLASSLGRQAGIPQKAQRTTYEIVTTLSVAGKSDWDAIKVNCVPKATAYSRAVDNSRESRGAAAIAPVKLDADKLAALKDRAYGLQKEFFELFPHNLNGAERNCDPDIRSTGPGSPLLS